MPTQEPFSHSEKTMRLTNHCSLSHHNDNRYKSADQALRRNVYERPQEQGL